jgi:hypothetical protein
MGNASYVEEDFLDPFVRECGECSGEMCFKGSGRYVCTECGSEYLTDFGRIKQYLVENGPQNAFQIADATGISYSKICEFIRQGRIDVVQKKALGKQFCAACGVELEFGTFCPACAKQIKRGKTDKNKAIYNVILKNKDNKDGEMRFLQK